MKKKICAILLAAGKGTRMRSLLPKVLVPLANRPMIEHLLESLADAGVEDRVLVIGHGADELRRTLGDNYRYALQEEQKGMAHAVSMAAPMLNVPGGPERIIVTVGDSPLLKAETIRRMLDIHDSCGSSCTFLTTVYDETPPYARVIRDSEGKVTDCVESHGASPEILAVREVLTSHYVFESDALWNRLDRIKPHPHTGELYLTDIIGILIREGHHVEAVQVQDSSELTGLNTPEEVMEAEKYLMRDY